MKRNNLNGLEIRNVDGQSIIDVTNEKARQIRRDMDAAGLQVYTIGSPVGKIDIETGDWETHKEKFKHLLEVTEILGAENMRIFSFFIPKGKDPENYRNEVIDRLGWLLEQAKGVVELCHENEKEIYGDIASRCLTLYQTLPELRAIFDPANFIQSGQPTLPAWDMLHSYIKYMHIKDALNDGKVVPPGCGEGHLRQIIPAYLKQGGTCFTVEQGGIWKTLVLLVYPEHFTPSTVSPEGTKKSISTKKSGKSVGFRIISVKVNSSPAKTPSVEKLRLYSMRESVFSFSFR
jgi:sugar phosphate isomerase/epimerase